MNPTGQQLLIVLLVVLLLFGAKRLPDLARSMGASVRELRAGVRDLSEDRVAHSSGTLGEDGTS